MGHDHRRCGHGQDGGHGHDSAHHDHRHEEPARTSSGASSLTAKERLILRLEHQIRHNSEHAGAYENLAAEAEALGYAEAACCLRTAAQSAALQNENLRQALTALRG